MPQLGEAGGAAQLPGQRLLSARPPQRVLEVLFGGRGGVRGSLQQDQLALDAQELRDAPILLVTLGSGERLVDRRESLGNFPVAGQALRHGAEQGGVVRDEAGLAELVEGVAEKREAATDLAALDEPDAVQAATPRMPDGERVPGRMVEQHRHGAPGRRQIAAPERDQTRRLQRVAQRERVIDRPSVLDVALGGPQSLIGESLQPEDPRQYHAARHPLVVLKADSVRPVGRGDIATEHALEVTPCVRLISQVVQGDAHHPVADGHVGRIGRAGHPVAEALRQRQRRAALAAADAEMPQAPERPQLILDVVDALGDLERGRPGGRGVGRGALRLHERHAKGSEELHLAASASTRARFEAGERAFDAAATLDHQ